MANGQTNYQCPWAFCFFLPFFAFFAFFLPSSLPVSFLSFFLSFFLSSYFYSKPTSFVVYLLLSTFFFVLISSNTYIYCVQFLPEVSPGTFPLRLFHTTTSACHSMIPVTIDSVSETTQPWPRLVQKTTDCSWRCLGSSMENWGWGLCHWCRWTLGPHRIGKLQKKCQHFMLVLRLMSNAAQVRVLGLLHVGVNMSCRRFAIRSDSFWVTGRFSNRWYHFKSFIYKLMVTNSK